MITIVDTGLCNIGSVANMLRRLGVRPTVATQPADLAEARAIVLPGIGHFDAAMKQLRTTGLAEALSTCVLDKKVPILGICLGMQLFGRSSQEGSAPGLGWLNGEVVRFGRSPPLMLPVPHMGWREVTPVDDVFCAGFEPGQTRFYFVHSFHFVPHADGLVAAWATYGVRFAAAVRRDHIWGAQFHPEKSHRHGLLVLRNFIGSVKRDS